jgi:hypothetical protein
MDSDTAEDGLTRTNGHQLHVAPTKTEYGWSAWSRLMRLLDCAALDGHHQRRLLSSGTSPNGKKNLDKVRVKHQKCNWWIFI